MTAPDLKPCPFCGGEAEIWRAHRGLTAWIACMGRCAVLVSKEYTADEEAIAAWNTRAPLAEALAVPEVAALEIWKLANTRDPDDPVFLAALRAALDEAEARAVKAEAERDAANALLQLADDALTEAEAILGGEYGDHYATLCETMIELRGKIAARAALKENSHE